jgi:hypothetical protein
MCVIFSFKLLQHCHNQEVNPIENSAKLGFPIQTNLYRYSFTSNTRHYRLVNLFRLFFEAVTETVCLYMRYLLWKTPNILNSGVSLLQTAHTIHLNREKQNP